MFPTSPQVLKRAIAWIDRRSLPGKTLVAIEGTNSYDSGLTRALRATELDICEVRPPRRISRAGRGQSDDFDALAAACTSLGEQVEALLDPCSEGDREALRMRLNARSAMERQGTADRLMLTVLLRTMDLGVDSRHALTEEQVRQINRWRTHGTDDMQTRIARAEATRLATAINEFRSLPVRNKKQLNESVDLLAAGLLDLPGLGPVCAAHVLVSYSHHGRGVPGPGVLGKQRPAPAQPPWLRAVEQGAAHDCPVSDDLRPVTKEYVERQTSEGKSIREIRRSIKRFIARQLFKKLQTLLT